jgi:3-methyladenine DNA glycosylase AlkD
MTQLSASLLEKQLLALGNLRRSQAPGQNEDNYYRTKFRILGHSVPQQRRFYKELLYKQRETLESLSPRARFKLWNEIWTSSDCFEVLNIPLIYYSDPKNHSESLAVAKPLLEWAKRLDNWAHSDSLSSIYARLLEAQGPAIDRVLKKWNTHSNPWLRRQSLVSLYYYSAQRQSVFPVSEALRRLRPLLGDSHYYVQKGVGWTLREAYNVAPEQVLAFIEANLHSIRPAAYTAATEKLNARQKEKLRRQRKEHRKLLKASKMKP